MEVIRKKENSVLVFHPAQQHSYRLATALIKKNLLHSYVTTIYYNPKRFVYKLLSKLLGENNTKRMEGRKLPVIEHMLKQYNEILGLFFLFWLRFDKKYRYTFSVFTYLSDVFGEKVAKYAVNNNAKAVIGYDTAATKCFELISKNDKSIIKILDMSSAAGSYIRNIIKQDIESGNPFFESYNQKLRQYSEKSCKYFDKEILLSDYFLVPSNFSKNSLLSLGIKEKQIYMVPYGVDLKRFTIKYGYELKEKIRFLFVGRLEAAKGIYSLLQAFKQIGRDDVELVLVGSTCGTEHLLEPYKNYYTYLGTKLSSEMPEVFKSADVYIMPSMWEGFSLTLLEAMASGVPVIASNNSGAEGVITDGEEGFVFNAGDIEQLKNRIIWFADNREQIKKMGQNARKTAEKYTWENYEAKAAIAIAEIVNGESVKA